MAVCPVCKLETGSIQRLEYHLKNAHTILVSRCFRSYDCNDGCSRDFLDWKTYRQHLMLFHKVPVSVHNSSKASCKDEPPKKIRILDHVNDHNASIPSTSFSSASQTDNFSCSAIGSDSSNTFHVPDFHLLQETIENNAKALFSSLYSNKSVSRTFIQTVVSEMSEFFGNTVSCVKDFIQSELCASGASPSISYSVNRGLSVLKRPFANWSSDYLRLKNFKKMPKWVEPEDLVIGDAEDLTASSVVPVEVKMSYIPLAKSLKCFFESPGIFQSVLEFIDLLKSESDDDVVSNFIQSELWKSKIGNKPGIHIPIFKFYDDFQVNNSLGPHCDSGKLGGVYCSIPVLPPKLRSQVDNIFVVLLFKSHDRDSFSNAPVFRKVIEELKDLQENGVTINVDGLSHTVFFHLGLVIGDNLGINSMFDFVACFKANHSCRFCRIHRDALHFAGTENSLLLRDRDNYSADVITNDPSSTGVLRDSIWNSLPNFHVTENYCVDIMHDFLQGVCHYDMAHIISYFIKKGYFTLDDLNFHIGSHNYGCLKGENRPTSIRADALNDLHFKMSASEMLTFVRNFSVMMGHLVPVNDPVWYFYLLLRQMLDIVLCPVVTPMLCDLFESLVEEHNHLYFVLFKDTLKPKMHNLVHYSKIMRKVGPLVHTWCMRFESKNRAHAIVARATQSRKNICKTLAIREQITQATKGDILSLPDVEFSPLKHCDLFDKDSDFVNFLPCLPFGGNCMSASFVVYMGVEYKIDSYIYIDSKDEGGLPLFGKICYIVVNADEDFRFLVHAYDTKYFCNHFHAYVVNHAEPQYKCVKAQDLVQSQIFNGNFNGRLYITSRHIV